MSIGSGIVLQNEAPYRNLLMHGFFVDEKGEKMSKSRGNFVDPRQIAGEFGVDALRYFLLREMPFGNDGDFSREALKKRYNAELANDLGNLLNRTVDMADRYLGAELPRRAEPGESGRGCAGNYPCC